MDNRLICPSCGAPVEDGVLEAHDVLRRHLAEASRVMRELDLPASAFADLARIGMALRLGDHGRRP